MEPQYGAGTDPLPYFLLAYGFGAVCFVGFAVWILWDRARLRRLLATLAAQPGTKP